MIRLSFWLLRPGIAGQELGSDSEGDFFEQQGFAASHKSNSTDLNRCVKQFVAMPQNCLAAGILCVYSLSACFFMR
jgi:hypothetical protein